MARQNRTKTETTVDTTVETPTEESTVTETPATETPAEVVADLEPFKAAVAEALKAGDTTTGELPDEAVKPVNEAYRGIETTKGKKQARDFLQEGLLAAVGVLEPLTARGYSDLSAKLSAAGGSVKADKAPVDPKAAIVARLTAVRLAYDIVASQMPEGVDQAEVVAEVQKMVEASAESVATYGSWMVAEVPEGTEKADAPEVTSVVKQAFKLASGKVTGKAGTSSRPSGEPRKSTAPHILSAFADKNIGDFLTIAEIAGHKSAEYGDESPSQGAISARLFPTTTIAGLEPVEKGAIDGKNPKGARKIAVA